jgi:hypothetical protein
MALYMISFQIYNDQLRKHKGNIMLDIIHLGDGDNIGKPWLIIANAPSLIVCDVSPGSSLRARVALLIVLLRNPTSFSGVEEASFA